MQSCLIKIAAAFNRGRLTWALGASMLLHCKGLVSRPNDIDLMVAPGDIDAADGLLGGMGVRRPPRPSGDHGTEYFREYVVDSVDIDLMAGFVIHHPGGSYAYRLNPAAFDTVAIEGVTVHLCPMADWYVLYALMPGRQGRVDAVGAYLREHPREAERLRFWLSEDIPQPLAAKIRPLLAGQ